MRPQQPMPKRLGSRDAWDGIFRRWDQEHRIYIELQTSTGIFTTVHTKTLLRISLRAVVRLLTPSASRIFQQEKAGLALSLSASLLLNSNIKTKIPFNHLWNNCLSNWASSLFLEFISYDHHCIWHIVSIRLPVGIREWCNGVTRCNGPIFQWT